jgi:Xaa-Pro dipeptidase
LLLNKQRALQHLEAKGLDVLIATMPENVTYLTEFWGLSFYLSLPQTYAFALFSRDYDPALIVSLTDANMVADTPSAVKDVRFFGRSSTVASKGGALSESETKLDSFILDAKPLEDAFKAIRAVVQDRGLEKGRIGIDESGIRPSDWKRFEKILPQASLSEAASTLREIRMVKTSEEVDRLRIAAEISEKGLKAMHAVAREGVSEEELAREFLITICREGASSYPVSKYPGFDIGCGTRSAFVSAQPTDYKLRNGDFIRLDGGCVYKYYYSDLANVSVLGEPSAKQKKYWLAVLKGTKEAVNAIRPGVKPSRLFEIAMNTVRKEGIPHYERNHVGHGIGIEIYDAPSIGKDVNTPLEENMVVNIETPYYEVGFGGVQVEHTVLVTKSGFRYLTREREKESELITI